MGRAASCEKHSSAYNPWTSEDKLLVKELFFKGKTFEEMSETLNRSIRALERELVRQGILFDVVPDRVS